MSRISNKAVVMPLHESIMFGQIPALSDEEVRKSKRLSDQIEALRDKGYQEGFDIGYANGVVKGTAEGKQAGFQMSLEQAQAERIIEASQFLADWETMRQEFEQAILHWYETTEKVLTDLSMEVVRRITQSELATNQEIALEIAKDVLGGVTNAKQVRIRINPNDFALFESHREALTLVSADVQHIEFVTDSAIHSGVMVETDAGVIDATVDTRLELLQKEFDQAA